jgi:hypothetical protein
MKLEWSVRVMETQISEIQKPEINGKQARNDFLKTTGNGQCFLSEPELHAIVKIESCLLRGERVGITFIEAFYIKIMCERGEVGLFGHEEDSEK